MFKYFLTIILVFAFSHSNNTTKNIKQEIIQQSINGYPGRCPCPYNVTSNGHRCGGRSAWSKAGGYSPICYEDEITDDMIKQYKLNGFVNK